MRILQRVQALAQSSCSSCFAGSGGFKFLARVSSVRSAFKGGGKLVGHASCDNARVGWMLVQCTFVGAGGIEVTIDCPDDRYILDIAIDNGVELPFSCRGGVCGACVGRVTAGQVQYKIVSLSGDGK